MSSGNPGNGKLLALLAAAIFFLMVTAALAAQITGFFVVEEKEADSGIPQADPAAANATTTEPVSITGAAIAPQESTFLQPVVGFLRRIFLFWRD